MAWPKRKPDPISDRARLLNQEIAALESQIKKLGAQLERNPPKSTSKSVAAVPEPLPFTPPPPDAAPGPGVTTQEPIFERIDPQRLNARPESGGSRGHYNELGVRKYDLPALFGRIRNHFRGPATANPKLVSYLAAGGIQGLRPLRYEKRVARNRFIALVVFLFVILLGIVLVFYRHH